MSADPPRILAEVSVLLHGISDSLLPGEEITMETRFIDDLGLTSIALANLSGRVSSYQRTWTDTDRFNAVQDMLFHFPDTGSARIFLHSTQDTLKSARVESSGPLPGVPGAYRAYRLTSGVLT